MKLSRVLLCACLFGAGASPVALATDTISVTSKLITEFKTGSSQTKFGPLEFVGGIEFTSRDARLESLSSIRFRPDGRNFVAVIDNGDWMTGAIERDATGRLSDLSKVEINPMLNARGRYTSKRDFDAEGLALKDGQAIVSYEGRARVDVYPDPGFETSGPIRTLNTLIPRKELRMNGGIETVVAAPASSPLEGALVIVAESSVDDQGNLLAAILDGPLKGQFTVVRHDPYDATDGVFLPDGDLLLLERRFSYLGGLGMRIRRIAGGSIRSGAVVDGDVILEADMGYAIDNMEGIDLVTGPDGKPHLILVSDDNGNFFQRSVMLEFRLTP